MTILSLQYPTITTQFALTGTGLRAVSRGGHVGPIGRPIPTPQPTTFRTSIAEVVAHNSRYHWSSLSLKSKVWSMTKSLPSRSLTETPAVNLHRRLLFIIWYGAAASGSYRSNAQRPVRSFRFLRTSLPPQSVNDLLPFAGQTCKAWSGTQDAYLQKPRISWPQRPIQ